MDLVCKCGKRQIVGFVPIWKHAGRTHPTWFEFRCKDCINLVEG